MKPLNKPVRDQIDARRFMGGARKEFIQAVKRLAGEVREGRSPSECWREVEAQIARLDKRETKVRRQVR